MNNLARSIDAGAIHHRAGEVVGITGTTLRVKAGGGHFEARRGASCLREPALGDLVELSLVEGGDCYVTAVLEAKAGAATRIAVDGDLELAATGRVGLSSPERLDLTTEGEVQVTAGRVGVRSVEIFATFERVVALGK